MPCYHPLKGFPIGINPSGKPKYLRCSFDTLYVGLDKDKIGGDYRWIAVRQEDIDCRPELGTRMGRVMNFQKVVTDFVYQTCGNCLGCRLMYAKQWADRCLMEAQYHKENWFVTLTYDEDHISVIESVDKDGVYRESGTLEKRELQLFWKRLRKELDKDDIKIRYYVCGEYGDQTHRPHYHAIIFGLHIPDLKLYKKGGEGSPSASYWTSEMLERAWGKGRVLVAEAVPETMCYVARYVVKKQKGVDAKIYDDLGIEAPFVTCSRRPGIARQWYDEHGKKFVDQSVIHISTPKGCKAITPPRYFLNLLEQDLDPAEWEEFKGRRLVGIETIEKLRSELTSEDYLAYLETQEAVVAKKVHLNRGAI